MNRYCSTEGRRYIYVVAHEPYSDKSGPQLIEERYLFLDADREFTAVRNLSGKGLIRPQRRSLGQEHQRTLETL